MRPDQRPVLLPQKYTSKRNELFSSDRQPGSVARVFAAGLCATSTGGVRPDVACLDTQADRRVRAGGMCPRLMSVCAMWRRVVLFSFFDRIFWILVVTTLRLRLILKPYFTHSLVASTKP